MDFKWLSNITSSFSASKNVAIDVSDFSVEILVLSPSKKIVAYDREIIPAGTVVEGEIKNPAYLAEIIKLVIGRNKALKGRKLSASFVFPKIKTFISHFEYDASALDEELDELVRKEVSNFFPDSMDSIVWDFTPLAFKDKAQPKRKMLYAVAGKPVVDGYIETAKHLGVSSFSIEAEPILLRRALLPQINADSSCMVVDIGANATSFYIFTSKETIEFTSNTKIGGEKITEAISASKKISKEEAEKLKTTEGLRNQDIKQTIIDTMSPVKDVISYLIDKHERTTGEKFSKIILVGGGALLPGIDAYFKDTFSKEVIMGDPLLSLNKASEGFFTEARPAILFANVIGSALKNIHKSSLPKRIDFAPAEYKAKDKKNIYLLVFAVFLIILMGLVLNMLFGPKKSTEEAVTPAEAEVPTETVPLEVTPEANQ